MTFTERCWTYEQKTGFVLDPSNAYEKSQGYSGFGIGKNNPDDHTKGEGPIPRNVYTIEAPHDSVHVGPYAMCLTPSGDGEMYGRGDFLIHGDSKEHPGSASHGCIILPRFLREKIWNSGVHMIEVVHG